MSLVRPGPRGPGARAERRRLRRLAARRRHGLFRDEGHPRLPRRDGLRVHHPRPRGARLRRLALKVGNGLHSLLNVKGPPPGQARLLRLHPRRRRVAPGHQPLAALPQPLRPPPRLGVSHRRVESRARQTPQPRPRRRRRRRRRRRLGGRGRRPRRRPVPRGRRRRRLRRRRRGFAPDGRGCARGPPLAASPAGHRDPGTDRATLA
mmetsp:Transcript_19179/g.65857  ORF Transcript_19179/g.65857 Transcript_19179/m.65857 type:complete len:206 (+) Transcript_19179:1369-1986(+)